ncbi:uncharacterized protein [Rutidosis leptorrhynchoides]|uniref:uncharacterized protein n=1 Tax=Rutidosis leptorrhynchoides TaxID=125765 RepID=UPI003A99A9F5
MKILSVKIRGSKERKKRVWVQEMCYKNNVQFLGIQESKITRLELFRIKTLWGNYTFDYACSLSRGMSGGLISVPQDSNENSALWRRLQEFMGNHIGHYISFGDMNVVRFENERVGSDFSLSEANSFNSFIENSELLDIPLEDRNFTWMNKAGSKLSRLDRFLVTHGVSEAIMDLHLTALPCGPSDHTPLLLFTEKMDFGPIPFKSFNSWFYREGFDNCVKHAIADSIAAHKPFNEILKHVKTKIKEWNHASRSESSSRISQIASRITDIDLRIDFDIASLDEKEERINLCKEHEEIQHLDHMDIL